MRIIRVKVKPNARATRLERLADGTYAASLEAPPVDGRANAELVTLLAREFDCPKSAIRIKAGAGARLKLVRIAEP
jgi:hypothetical protein